MDTIHLKVNLNFQQLLEMIKQLSPSEKLELNDFLWNDAMEIPVEHQKMVLERIQKSKVNPNNMLDWDDVSKTLTV
ncbi:MAG: addiction module protein [Lutibacter sp.]|jgi:hypothetical protein|nr:addiction module protein [Lutibacter sp.]MDO9594965.1 addiction module protein [Lutibacter sp.]